MFGRLGNGSQKDELFPKKLNFRNPDGTQDSVKIVGIAAGSYHSLALAGSLTLHTFLIFSFNLQLHHLIKV